MKVGSEIKSERGIILKWSIISNGTSRTKSILVFYLHLVGGTVYCNLCKSEIPYNICIPYFSETSYLYIFILTCHKNDKFILCILEQV